MWATPVVLPPERGRMTQLTFLGVSTPSQHLGSLGRGPELSVSRPLGTFGWGGVPCRGPLWGWWVLELQDLEAPLSPERSRHPGKSPPSKVGASLQTLLKGDRTRASGCVGPGREEGKCAIKVPDEEGEQASAQTAGSH